MRLRIVCCLEVEDVSPLSKVKQLALVNLPKVKSVEMLAGVKELSLIFLDGIRTLRGEVGRVPAVEIRGCAKLLRFGMFGFNQRSILRDGAIVKHNFVFFGRIGYAGPRTNAEGVPPVPPPVEVCFPW